MIDAGNINRCDAPDVRVCSRLLRVVAALIIVIGPAGCSTDEETVIQRTVGDTDPDQMLVSPRIVITENGRTSAIVTADSLTVIENRDLTTLDGHVDLQFHNREGVHTTTLTARRGRLWGLYEHVDSLRAMGDVVVVSTERGERLETQELRWIFTERTVYADGFVKITTKDGFEQGYGLTAKDDLSSYSLREVSGEVRGRDFTLPER
jgi:LPS export ABC transporter protein LptC